MMALSIAILHKMRRVPTLVIGRHKPPQYARRISHSNLYRAAQKQ